MARAARKQYGFDAKSVVEPHFLDVVSATAIDRQTEKEYTCNASDLSVPLAIGSALLSAVIRLYDGRCKTVKAAWGALKRFCEFLASDGPVSRVEDIDRQTLERYRFYLRGRSVKERRASKTIYRQFQFAQTIAAEALRVRRIALRTIDNPFPGISRDGGAKAHLDLKDLGRILAAAKREVTENWREFTEGQRRTSRAVQFVRDHWGGVLPVGAWTDEEFEAIRGDLTFEEISRRLHATRDSILPFMLLIGYSTAANIFSLAEMGRECLSNGLLPDSCEIRWAKNRARIEQSVVRSSAGRFSAPTLIRQVLELTGPLTAHAAKRDRSRLFLVRNGLGVVSGVSPDMWQAALPAFLERNNLRKADGTLIDFSFDMLRPTVLAETYRRTGDLLAVHRFANHAYLSTTVRYVVDRVTDELHDGAISRSQGKLHKFVLSDAKEEEGMKEPPVRARGVSSDCAYIYRGPSMKGECPAWLWPLNDPGLVVPADPRVIAELIRLRMAIESARPRMDAEAFSMRFATALATVDEILRSFSEEIIAEAEKLARGLPPLPDLAYE